MLSTSSFLPVAFVAAAISASGFRIPELVSQWMAMTWVMAGSAAIAALTSSPRGADIAFVDHGELPSKIADRLGSTKPVRAVR